MSVSRLQLTKRYNGEWSYQEKSVGLVLPTDTESFMEGHLGICKGNQYIVELATPDEPTVRHHVHVNGYKIIKVLRVDTLNDGTGTAIEVQSFEFDS